MPQVQDNALITEIQMLPSKNESEWEQENPIIPYMFGAYSKDTHMLRIGNGSLPWKNLPPRDPASYVGPHAHTHAIGGADPISNCAMMLYGTANTELSTVAGETSTILYSNIDLSHENFFKYSNGIFTYNDDIDRHVNIVVRQRYIRNDISNTGLNKAYNIATTISVNSVDYENYGCMNIGFPWTEIYFSVSALLKKNHTVKISFTPAVDTHCFRTGDDPNVPANSCCTISMFSID